MHHTTDDRQPAEQGAVILPFPQTRQPKNAPSTPPSQAPSYPDMGDGDPGDDDGPSAA